MGAPFWSSASDKEAARCRREPEHAEVVAGDERPHHGFRNGLRSGATDGNGPPGVAGLHCGQLFELRQVLLEHVVGVCGEERVIAVVVPSAIDAAVILVPDSDKGVGVHDRQVMQQDGVDQGEDGRVGADAQRQRQQSGDRVARSLAQLAECITQILQENSHRFISTDVSLHRQKGTSRTTEYSRSRAGGRRRPEPPT